jgi:hypothetical protein
MSTITGTDPSGLIKAIQTDVYGNLIVITNPEVHSKVVIYGDQMVGAGATMVLATYTVPASKRFFYKGGLVGGGEEGQFSFEISTARIGLWRNSGSAKSAVITFPEFPEASTGAIITISVKNISNKTRQFEATLYGYTMVI